MPIFYYDTKDAVPADLLDAVQEVTEGDNKGKFGVNVVPRKKMEEFRDNNIEISKRLEKAEGLISKVLSATGVKSLDEFDPAKFTEELGALKDTAQKVADGKLQAKDDVEKEVAKRTEAMREKFNTDLQAAAVEKATLKRERDEAIAQFKRTFIDKAVAQVIADPDLGLEPTALVDVVSKAYNVFKVQEDNSLRPESGNGQTMWGEDGTTPMNMKEWINIVLRKESPHYFKKSTGGGANGGDNTKQFGGMTEAEFNKLSPQRRLEIANQMAFAKSR
jgi:hypothetical protein